MFKTLSSRSKEAMISRISAFSFHTIPQTFQVTKVKLQRISKYEEERKRWTRETIRSNIGIITPAYSSQEAKWEAKRITRANSSKNQFPYLDMTIIDGGFGGTGQLNRTYVSTASPERFVLLPRKISRVEDCQIL